MAKAKSAENSSQIKGDEPASHILDIDETSLSSYCESIAEDFGYIPDRWEKWIVSNEAAIPIPGADRPSPSGVDRPRDPVCRGASTA